MELDLLLRFQVHALMQAIEESGTIPVLDLTPGIRSLQIHIDPSRITVSEACKIIVAALTQRCLHWKRSEYLRDCAFTAFLG